MLRRSHQSPARSADPCCEARTVAGREEDHATRPEAHTHVAQRVDRIRQVLNRVEQDEHIVGRRVYLRGFKPATPDIQSLLASRLNCKFGNVRPLDLEVFLRLPKKSTRRATDLVELPAGLERSHELKPGVELPRKKLLAAKVVGITVGNTALKILFGVDAVRIEAGARIGPEQLASRASRDREPFDGKHSLDWFEYSTANRTDRTCRAV